MQMPVPVEVVAVRPAVPLARDLPVDERARLVRVRQLLGPVVRPVPLRHAAPAGVKRLLRRRRRRRRRLLGRLRQHHPHHPRPGRQRRLLLLLLFLLLA